jgi:NADH-quinone oxidoreductase subunit N
MMIFMLSLAGIPPLAGFFGKFYLFTSALNADPFDLGLLWLVVAALALSAVSLYYYLQVLKQIYVAEPGQETGAPPMPMLSQVTIALLALAVVVLGCAPDLLMGRLIHAIQAAGF